MASVSPKILVFGATGSIGSEVAKALLRRKTPFRAIVHTASKADHLKKEGAGLVEIVEADLYNLDSIAKAAEGIEVVFLMTPPGHTHQNAQIGDTLKKAGVKRIVKLSALGCEDGEKFQWAKEHLDAENHFKSIGLPYTSLRPSAFHSNWFNYVPTVKGQNVFFNAAREAKLNHISTHDIGEVAAVALTTPGHEGKNYNITGPDTITFAEGAELLSEVLGRKINYVGLSDEDNRKAAANFLPPQAIDGWVNMYQYFAAGGYNKHFDDLEKLTGTKGTSLKDFFTANAAAFQ